jgi:hypothetical protein
MGCRDRGKSQGFTNPGRFAAISGTGLSAVPSAPRPLINRNPRYNVEKYNLFDGLSRNIGSICYGLRSKITNEFNIVTDVTVSIPPHGAPQQ